MTDKNLALKQYKKLAQSYNRRFQKFIKITTHKAARRAAIAPGDKVLDLGCGTGEMLFRLGQDYPQVGLLAGIDASEDMLKLAKTKLASTKAVRLRLGTVEKLPYPDEHFDLIISVGVIHYVQHVDYMTKEALRVLKPHGRILLIDMAAEFMTTKLSSLFRRLLDPGAVRYYSLDSASRLLRTSGFEIQSAELFQAGIFGLYLIEGAKP